MNEQNIKTLVEQIVSEVVSKGKITSTECNATESSPVVSNGEVPDLSAIDYKQRIDVPNAENLEVFAKMRAKTVARVGVWRAGPRYRTNTYLRFCCDHAAAMDAVFNDVNDDFLKDLGLFSVTTLCDSKDSYLTRPDLGKKFSEETIKEIQSKCKKNPEVQIVISDGLSSTSVEANMKDLLPALMQGLKASNLDVGTPFFIKHGRVGAMDAVTEALGAKVTVILIGERPGLASGESLSAYMTYDGYVGIPETNRTVISNIHRGGTNPVETGAFIAELCGRMLKEKVSGLDLKL